MKIITCTTPLLEQNMYIVEEGKHCIVIDPYYDEKTAVLLEGKIVDLLLVTHEHYDHISGVNKFKELYGCKLLSNSKCDNNLQRPAKNFSKYFEAYYEFQADLQKPILLLTAIIHAAQMSFLMTALPLDGSIILCLSRWFPGTAKAVISSS